MENNLLVRFEHKRGHCMAVAGKQPWKPKDCDEFQLRMLRSCEVPGLLKLEAAVLDGEVTFRYKLDGTRMLSALLKAGKWTMTEWLTVLHRLAEILEECRLYMLDEDRICLGDDWIFVGKGWHDLHLVYLPLLLQQPPLAERLRLLLTRWILFVKDPDGRMLQHLLELLSSPDLRPAALRSFARKFLREQSLADEGERLRGTAVSYADASGGTPLAGVAGDVAGWPSASVAEASLAGRPGSISGSAVPEWSSPGASPAGKMDNADGQLNRKEGQGGGGEAGASSGGFFHWRWLQPFRSDAPGLPGGPEEKLEPQSISWLIGHAADEQDEASAQREPLRDQEDAEQADRFRQKLKIWLICAAVGLSAAGWRWGYAEHPDTNGLVLSMGVTMVAFAGALLIYRRLVKRGWRAPEAAAFTALQPAEEPAPPRVFRPEAGKKDTGYPVGYADFGQRRSDPMDTVMGDEWSDRTQQLTEEKHETSPRHASFLLWETAPGTPRIPLSANSFLIGRSREACAHVDETKGVSRVHLELLRTEDGWTARDLGSRNGTKLNGVPMVAYAAYPLQTDDCLELAGSRYRLK